MGLQSTPKGLVIRTSTRRAIRSEQLASGWTFSLYPDALEGGGCWNGPRAVTANAVPRRLPGQAANTERSMQESGRRARAAMRRYVVANRCDKMITLTYADACHDRDQFVADMHDFFLRLREAMDGVRRPYLWVPEWHKNHGLHAHAAVSHYVPFTLVREVWGRGRVRIERMAGAPTGHANNLVIERARICARYLAKYIGKDFDDERRVLGRHRYGTAEGFKPRKIVFTGPTREHIYADACEHMGRPADNLWFSPDDANFTALWAGWRAG
jgi:hypothetical protein